MVTLQHLSLTAAHQSALTRRLSTVHTFTVVKVLIYVCCFGLMWNDVVGQFHRLPNNVFSNYANKLLNSKKFTFNGHAMKQLKFQETVSIATKR